MQREMDIQSIVRVLSVIETLNQRNVSSVDVIHTVTGLPKPTLVRILATLVGMGYVFHVSRRDGYALTEKVLRLSAGFRYHDAIVDIARPLLEAFTAQHKWQLSISTLETDAMRVRFNTRHLSPFAPEQLYLNKRVGMLDSAMGRAYLAFCPDIERDLIVKFARAAEPERFNAPGHEAELERLLETIRAKRYATIERSPGNRVRSIAVPVLSAESGAAMGSIALFYFAGVMSEAQAADTFLEDLYAIGKRIADALIDMHAQSADAHADCPPSPPKIAKAAPLDGKRIGTVAGRRGRATQVILLGLLFLASPLAGAAAQPQSPGESGASVGATAKNQAIQLYNRAVIFEQAKRYDQAIADFTSAIALDPDFIDAYASRGVAYDQKGFYDRAIADYSHAIAAADPARAQSAEFATTYFNRGAACEHRRLYRQAIADYRAALKLDPSLQPPKDGLKRLDGKR